MHIAESTKQYESWLAQQTTLVHDDLEYKHRQMSAGAFPFLRATFYQWTQVWPQVCPELVSAPTVLAVGDIHVDNFGTWRDHEGRLIWGVNDFDETYPLPYTNDLTRLAVSAGLEMATTHLHIDLKMACDSILTGYREGMEGGGKPFTLAEEHTWLREIAFNNLRDPVPFWEKMEGLPDYPSPLPADAAQVLSAAMPEPGLTYRAVRRRSGLGSLGRTRIVALTTWHGGRIAREIKALVPSACHLWNPTEDLPQADRYRKALSQAVRCPDPHVRLESTWILRRLAPDCCRIELSSLPGEKAALRLLHAMGKEVANIHHGSQDQISYIRHDLSKRPLDWLFSAATRMTRSILHNWEDWKA